MHTNNYLFGDEILRRCYGCRAWRIYINHAHFSSYKEKHYSRVVCPCITPRYIWEEAAKHVHQ